MNKKIEYSHDYWDKELPMQAQQIRLADGTLMTDHVKLDPRRYGLK